MSNKVLIDKYVNNKNKTLKFGTEWVNVRAVLG